MYHIKHDKRAESSVELICTAVLELLETKPLGEITVSDVQRRSTVSRSTFYRNFDSLEDVLALLCDRGFDEIAAGSGAPVYIRVFHYWFNNAAVLEALVRTGRADILAERKSCCSARRSCRAWTKHGSITLPRTPAMS